MEAFFDDDGKEIGWDEIEAHIKAVVDAREESAP